LLNVLIHAVTSLVGRLGYPGIVVLMICAAACIPIPSEAILGFSGALITIDPSRGFNFYAVALCGVAGDLLGAMFAYWVGARGGRPIVNKYGKYLLIRKRDVDRAEAFFHKYGEVTALFGRMIPLIRAFIALPAGIYGMSFSRFCLFSAIGSIPWCFGLTYAGLKLGEHWEDVQKVLHKADLAVSLVVIAAFIFWLWHHLRPEKEQAPD